MSRLSTLRRGRAAMPPRIVIYGTHGVGKSTLANDAGAVFVPTEDGLNQIDVSAGAFPMAQRLEDVYSALAALAEEPHDYPAVAIDTLDRLEQLIIRSICERERKPIEAACGGYGRGYLAALDTWRDILAGLDYLRLTRGMAIILLAHARVQQYANPLGEPYDRYTLDLHSTARANTPGLIQAWADVVGFASFRMCVKSTDDGKAHIGLGTGERLLYCQERPAYQAKSRYQIPPEIPLAWCELEKYLS